MVGEVNEKHLEMIQATVGRMATCSFAVKAWAIGLVSAVFALAALKDITARLLLVALLPVVLFWFLDAFYLRQERLFRLLYDAVRTGSQDVAREGPFSMSTRPYADRPEAQYLAVLLSMTTLPLYGVLALLVGAFALMR